MNFMNMLTGVLTSGASLQALSQKTGLSEKQLKMIIAIAIPLILRKLTSNASTQNGANSLLGALTQHRGDAPIGKQLEAADTEDGDKIIGHIFGDDQDQMVDLVARESGAAPDEVRSVLGNISPAVLNGLSSATEAASGKQEAKPFGVDLSDGFDLSDVLGMLGGASAQEDHSVNGTQLISSLLSMMK